MKNEKTIGKLTVPFLKDRFKVGCDFKCEGFEITIDEVEYVYFDYKGGMLVPIKSNNSEVIYGNIIDICERSLK